MMHASTLLVFAEGDMLCALDAAMVQEVVFLPELSHPPGMPSVLEGFMALDGDNVPVLRAARILGLAAAPVGIYAPAIILKAARAAVVCERVAGMLRLAPGDMREAPAGHSFNDCLLGIAQMNGQEVHVLSADRLLLKEEKQRISEFQALSQARLGAEGLAAG
jgi:purine-binding chemotaxis protein CheW